MLFLQQQTEPAPAVPQIFGRQLRGPPWEASSPTGPSGAPPPPPPAAAGPRHFASAAGTSAPLPGCSPLQAHAGGPGVTPAARPLPPATPGTEKARSVNILQIPIPAFEDSNGVETGPDEVPSLLEDDEGTPASCAPLPKVPPASTPDASQTIAEALQAILSPVAPATCQVRHVPVMFFEALLRN